MIIASIFAFALCCFLIFYCGPIAKNIGLVDKPDFRKGNVPPVPLIGGIMMFLALCLSSLLLPVSLQQYRYLLFSSGLLVIVGILDDHQDIPSYAKFVMQLLAAAILVHVDGQVIYFVGDIFEAFSESGIVRSQGLGFLAKPITVLAIVALVNFVNFFDGHDGVAGSACLTSLGGIVFLLVMADLDRHFAVIVLMMSVVSAFLCFNLPLLKKSKRKVYLGDAGSMFIGVFLAFLLIDLSQPGIGYSGWDEVIIPPPAVLWIIGIPLLDGVVVILERIARGVVPARPGRDHIHHLLSAAGVGETAVAVILVGLNGVFVSVGVILTLARVDDWIVFWGFVVAFLVYWTIRRRIR